MLPTGITLTAVAAVAAVAPAAAGAATPAQLTVDRWQVGGTDAPVTARAQVPAGAALRVIVNGRTVATAVVERRARVRIVHLSARQGLHAGRNTIRFVAGEGRARQVRTRTLRLRAPQLLADAGPDTAVVVAQRTRLGNRPGLTAPRTGNGGARHALRWRIVTRPRGATARLSGRTAARPTLHAHTAGSYRLRLTSSLAGRAVSHDTVVVDVRPDDPPIGIPFATHGTVGGRRGIVLDGRLIPDTDSFEEINYAVIDRETRAVMTSGHVARQFNPVNAVYKSLRDRYMNDDRYLAVFAGQRGLGRDTGGQTILRMLADLTRTREMMQFEADAVLNGSPFAYVGIIGGPAETGTFRSPWGTIEPALANIGGYLKRSAITKRYEFVSPERPTFDTQLDPRATTSNTMVVDHRQHNAVLGTGITAGFQLVSLDPWTFQATSVVLPTNASDPSKDAGLAQAAADTLRGALDNPRWPIIFLQSIGRPNAHSASWNGFADQIERLGGSRYLVNALDGRHSYALAGRVLSASPTAEASSVKGEPGQLIGSLARSRTSHFDVVLTDANSGLKTNLIDMAFQAPRGFPAFTGAGQQAAYTHIGKALRFCAASAASCDVRKAYWDDYQAAWGQKSTDLAGMTFPDDARGFDRDDFAAVKRQLAKEISAVNTVKTYFDALTRPFARSSGGVTGVDISALGNELMNTIAPPPDSATTGWTLGLISQVLKVGTIAPPPASNIASGVSGVFAVAAYLSDENEKPILANSIRTRTDQYVATLAKRYEMAERALNDTALLFVSDYGKLIDATSHIDDDWRLPSSDLDQLAAMRLAAKRELALATTMAAYPRLIRGTPPPRGPGDANGLSCYFLPDYTQQHPWRNQPRGMQTVATEGFDGNGSPIRPAVFVTTWEGDSPRDVSGILFGAVRAGTSGLGLSTYDFFTRKVYGTLFHANDTASSCDLPFIPR
ncbi:hypothetical protein VSS74_23005 [Conexibacter stalactiti]|uniref:Uncharacterized protein n=1 Tax=Conexibacter stalactiti TaxID=1940611 RepID=A0ABU4HV86_9ACTN|nr:hypothetical protein [Conexibacter stalactiti]MDW5597235.1 hypothetical protein [Conexibacter stalactiti]MEC5037877.1 hypothetical protein [Conexibacter stalactiti]